MLHKALAAVVLALTVSACGNGNLMQAGSKPTEQVAKMEEALAGAGFQPHYAKTAETLAAITSLPQHSLDFHQYQNQYRYVYADTELCGCVYIGDRDAYQRYQAMLGQASLSDLQIEANELTDPLPYDSTSVGPWFDPVY